MKLPIRVSNFYVRSTLFAALSLLAALLNYVLYPVLSRTLSPSEFGDFTSIQALVSQTLGLLLAFNIVSIYLVKNYPENVARSLAQTVQKILIWFFLSITVVILLLSPLLLRLLSIENPISFLILCLILITTIPSVIWTGYLQGHKKLINVGVFNFSASLLKFFLATFLAISFGAAGGLAGVLLGGVFGLALLRISTKTKLPQIIRIFTKLTVEERNFLHTTRSYLITSVIVVGGLGFLQNIDINYAKIIFAPTVAGIYSGVSILSNALYFGCFLLVWILLPEISLTDRNINHRLLRTAYSLLGIIAASALLVEIIFKNTLSANLLGNNFANQGNLLIFATIYQVSLVAVTLLAYYLLVIKDTRALWLGICTITPCFILPWMFSDTPLHMIISIWVSLILGFVIFVILNAFIIKRLRNNSTPA